VALEDQLRVIVARNQQARDAESGRVAGLLSAIEKGVPYDIIGSRDGDEKPNTEVLGQTRSLESVGGSNSQQRTTATPATTGEESGI